VAIYQRFGSTCRSHLQELSSPRRPSKIGQISCSTTSVTYYRNALRNIPEERRSHLYCGRSLKSRKSIWYINFRNLSPTFVFSAFLYHSTHFLSHCLSISHCRPFYCFTAVSARIAQGRRYQKKWHWTNSSTSGIISIRPLCTYTNTQAFRRCWSVYMSCTIWCKNCSRSLANCQTPKVNMSCVSNCDTTIGRLMNGVETFHA